MANDVNPTEVSVYLVDSRHSALEKYAKKSNEERLLGRNFFNRMYLKWILKDSENIGPATNSFLDLLNNPEKFTAWQNSEEVDAALEEKLKILIDLEEKIKKISEQINRRKVGKSTKRLSELLVNYQNLKKEYNLLLQLHPVNIVKVENRIGQLLAGLEQQDKDKKEQTNLKIQALEKYKQLITDFNNHKLHPENIEERYGYSGNLPVVQNTQQSKNNLGDGEIQKWIDHPGSDAIAIQPKFNFVRDRWSLGDQGLYYLAFAYYLIKNGLEENAADNIRMQQFDAANIKFHKTNTGKSRLSVNGQDVTELLVFDNLTKYATIEKSYKDQFLTKIVPLAAQVSQNKFLQNRVKSFSQTSMAPRLLGDNVKLGFPETSDSLNNYIVGLYSNYREKLPKEHISTLSKESFEFNVEQPIEISSQLEAYKEKLKSNISESIIWKFFNRSKYLAYKNEINAIQGLINLCSTRNFLPNVGNRLLENEILIEKEQGYLVKDINNIYENVSNPNLLNLIHMSETSYEAIEQRRKIIQLKKPGFFTRVIFYSVYKAANKEIEQLRERLDDLKSIKNALAEESFIRINKYLLDRDTLPEDQLKKLIEFITKSDNKRIKKLLKERLNLKQHLLNYICNHSIKNNDRRNDFLTYINLLDMPELAHYANKNMSNDDKNAFLILRKLIIGEDLNKEEFALLNNQSGNANDSVMRKLSKLLTDSKDVKETIGENGDSPETYANKYIISIIDNYLLKILGSESVDKNNVTYVELISDEKIEKFQSYLKLLRNQTQIFNTVEEFNTKVKRLTESDRRGPAHAYKAFKNLLSSDVFNENRTNQVLYEDYKQKMLDNNFVSIKLNSIKLFSHGEIVTQDYDQLKELVKNFVENTYKGQYPCSYFFFSNVCDEKTLQTLLSKRIRYLLNLELFKSNKKGLDLSKGVTNLSGAQNNRDRERNYNKYDEEYFLANLSNPVFKQIIDECFKEIIIDFRKNHDWKFDAELHKLMCKVAPNYAYEYRLIYFRKLLDKTKNNFSEKIEIDTFIQHLESLGLDRDFSKGYSMLTDLQKIPVKDELRYINSTFVDIDRLDENTNYSLQYSLFYTCGNLKTFNYFSRQIDLVLMDVSKNQDSSFSKSLMLFLMEKGLSREVFIRLKHGGKKDSSINRDDQIALLDKTLFKYIGLGSNILDRVKHVDDSFNMAKQELISDKSWSLILHKFVFMLGDNFAKTLTLLHRLDQIITSSAEKNINNEGSNNPAFTLSNQLTKINSGSASKNLDIESFKELLINEIESGFKFDEISFSYFNQYLYAINLLIEKNLYSLTNTDPVIKNIYINTAQILFNTLNKYKEFASARENFILAQLKGLLYDTDTFSSINVTQFISILAKLSPEFSDSGKQTIDELLLQKVQNSEFSLDSLKILASKLPASRTVWFEIIFRDLSQELETKNLGSSKEFMEKILPNSINEGLLLNTEEKCFTKDEVSVLSELFINHLQSYGFSESLEWLVFKMPSINPKFQDNYNHCKDELILINLYKLTSPQIEGSKVLTYLHKIMADFNYYTLTDQGRNKITKFLSDELDRIGYTQNILFLSVYLPLGSIIKEKIIVKAVEKVIKEKELYGAKEVIELLNQHLADVLPELSNETYVHIMELLRSASLELNSENPEMIFYPYNINQLFSYFSKLPINEIKKENRDKVFINLWEANLSFLTNNGYPEFTKQYIKDYGDFNYFNLDDENYINLQKSLSRINDGNINRGYNENIEIISHHFNLTDSLRKLRTMRFVELLESHENEESIDLVNTFITPNVYFESDNQYKDYHSKFISDKGAFKSLDALLSYFGDYELLASNIIRYIANRPSLLDLKNKDEYSVIKFKDNLILLVVNMDGFKAELEKYSPEIFNQYKIQVSVFQNQLFKEKEVEQAEKQLLAQVEILKNQLETEKYIEVFESYYDKLDNINHSENEVKAFEKTILEYFTNNPELFVIAISTVNAAKNVNAVRGADNFFKLESAKQLYNVCKIFNMLSAFFSEQQAELQYSDYISHKRIFQEHNTTIQNFEDTHSIQFTKLYDLVSQELENINNLSRLTYQDVLKTNLLLELLPAKQAAKLKNVCNPALRTRVTVLDTIDDTSYENGEIDADLFDNICSNRIIINIKQELASIRKNWVDCSESKNKSEENLEKSNFIKKIKTIVAAYKLYPEKFSHDFSQQINLFVSDIAEKIKLIIDGYYDHEETQSSVKLIVLRYCRIAFNILIDSFGEVFKLDASKRKFNEATVVAFVKLIEAANLVNSDDFLMKRKTLHALFQVVNNGKAVKNFMDISEASKKQFSKILEDNELIVPQVVNDQVLQEGLTKLLKQIDDLHVKNKNAYSGFNNNNRLSPNKYSP